MSFIHQKVQFVDGSKQNINLNIILKFSLQNLEIFL